MILRNTRCNDEISGYLLLSPKRRYAFSGLSRVRYQMAGLFKKKLFIIRFVSFIAELGTALSRDIVEDAGSPCDTGAVLWCVETANQSVRVKTTRWCCLLENSLQKCLTLYCTNTPRLTLKCCSLKDGRNSKFAKGKKQPKNENYFSI